jgi:hypothetical protein
LLVVVVVLSNYKPTPTCLGLKGLVVVVVVVLSNYTHWGDDQEHSKIAAQDGSRIQDHKTCQIITIIIV